MSNNLKRILSGIVLVLIIAAAGYFGGTVLLLFCLALSLLGMKEFFDCVGSVPKGAKIISSALCLVYYAALFLSGTEAIGYILPVSFVALMAYFLKKYPGYSIKDGALWFTGFFYPGFLMSFLYLVRIKEAGFYWFILIFLCSWLGDTFAYSFGRRLGKHKLCPGLSPKKSVEGFLAGVIGCTVFGILFGVFCKEKLPVAYPVLTTALCGFFGQLVSVAGDLSASAVKREFGVKDYSQLIPGHGGILDRFDSALFAAPFLYMILSIMEKF